MITAMILAAGESKRMGQPKMLLPWGAVTVLGQVISTYQAASVEDVLVVTGGAYQKVSEIVEQHGARSVFNEQYTSGEMLSSLQCGLRFLAREEPGTEAVLVGLGDQPQLQSGCVRQICETFRQESARLIVPSFQRRRGHPWLVEQSLWAELLGLQLSQSPRDFLNAHANEIRYVEVDTASILADLDTPQDYHNARPDP
jgi:molybdenum cofactor cytidylyltransferase